MSRRTTMIAGSVIGATLAVLMATFAYATTRDGDVVPGVAVEGIEVGRMSADEARSALSGLVTSRQDRTLAFTLDDQRFDVDPAAIGVAVDVDALVDQAMSVGRTGAMVGDRVRSLFGVDATIDVEVGLDTDALTARVEQIAGTVDREVFPGDIEIDGVTLRVTTEQPAAGMRTLVEDAVAAMSDAVVAAGDVELVLPVEVIEPDTDGSDLERVATLAADTIAQDMTLRSDDGLLILAPRDLATMLSVVATGDGASASLELEVTPTAVEDVLIPLSEDLTRDPKDPSFDAPSVPSTRFDAKLDATWRPIAASVTTASGINGTSIDPQVTADQLTAAIRAGAHDLQLRLTEEPPEHALADGVKVDTLLSTFTTYHACCADRVTNIQRLADTVDRTVVWPGEQFSINQISGVRECSKGYAAAGMIMNGEIVDSCGGGVSQFGTTTVNALFFAGLKPDAYKPHSFYISRYPMAREATLNYPSPDIDVKFTNDTGAPILVRTSHTSTSITVSFYGSSDVTEVRADVGSPTNYKSFKTIRRVNRSLPAGAERRVQGGQDGFYVSLKRTVVRSGGATTTDDWSNSYVSETEIVEYNPDKPKPEPTPEPTPEPEPTPDPDPAPESTEDGT